MRPAAADAIKQIDDILTKHKQLRSKSQYEDCSDQGKVATTELLALMSAAVERLAPLNSHYVTSVRAKFDKVGPTSAAAIPFVAGTLYALRTAYADGYLALFAELIHANLFSDFLEMSEHLLSEGYKDPSAVLIGSVLEEHLRQLSAKAGISVENNGRQKKADALNSELAGAGAYSKLDQKSVTAWLDLRNRAAHGKYVEYTKEQVALMLQAVRDFIQRLPA